MHYYIDGYNLLFRIQYPGVSFTTKREQLIAELGDLFHFLSINATLVFDSQYQEGESSRSHYHHVEIVYTNSGETADDRIISEIQLARYERITVVTSDKKLAWFARRCNASTESVEQFLGWLKKRYKNKQRPKLKAPPKARQKKATLKKSPEPEQRPEACYDYYLNTFQKSYSEAIEQEKSAAPPKKMKRAKPRAIPQAEKDSGVSDFDRWMRIFEERLGA